jgi:TPR repeat protein
VVAQAEAGDPEACFLLGRAYLKGEGVPRSLPRAHELLRRGAEAGHAESMGAYGFLLSRGLGCPQDDAAAVRWMQKSLEAARAPLTLFNLGIMTMKGRGVERDQKAGLDLIRQAAESGLVEAQVRLAEIHHFGEDGIFTDPGQAAFWAMKAADAGHAWAQNLVGSMKEFGAGLAMDGEGALAYYRKAAAQGDAKGQANVGRLLFNGLQVPADRVEACYWLRAASDQGEVTARKLLGEITPGLTEAELAAGEKRLKEQPPPRPPSTRPGPRPPTSGEADRP